MRGGEGETRTGQGEKGTGWRTVGSGAPDRTWPWSSARRGLPVAAPVAYGRVYRWLPSRHLRRRRRRRSLDPGVDLQLGVFVVQQPQELVQYLALLVDQRQIAHRAKFHLVPETVSRFLAKGSVKIESSPIGLQW